MGRSSLLPPTEAPVAPRAALARPPSSSVGSPLRLLPAVVGLLGALPGAATSVRKRSTSSWTTFIDPTGFSSPDTAPAAAAAPPLSPHLDQVLVVTVPEALSHLCSDGSLRDCLKVCLGQDLPYECAHFVLCHFLCCCDHTRARPCGRHRSQTGCVSTDGAIQGDPQAHARRCPNAQCMICMHLRLAVGAHNIKACTQP